MSARSGAAIDGTVAVVVARDGRLPVGAGDAVAEAAGSVVVVGSGSEAAAHSLVGARHARWAETGPGLRPAALAHALAPLLEAVPLVVMPASPDGRDLAPRVAAVLGRPLVARAVRAALHPGHGSGADGSPGSTVTALVARLDDRVLVPVDVDGPAVVTLVPGGRVPSLADAGSGADAGATIEPLDATGWAAPEVGPDCRDPELLALLEPDLHTMDLSDATRVLAGGAGLAAGTDDHHATELFALLVRVAGALGGSAGATRVATDAGWTGYERQIGTTGVTIDPDLYIAFGVSGATQHVGGLGTPRHVVSVNTDGASPMTAMADLGLVVDARSLLVEVADRLGVAVPADLRPVTEPGAHRG